MVAYTLYESDNRVRRYAETLARQGYQVDAVALREAGQSKDVTVLNGVRLFRIQPRVRNEKSKFAYLSKLLFFFLRSMFLLTREQMRRRYDLIHVHSVPDFEVFAALYPKLTGSKVILDIHDIVPEFYTSKFNTSPTSLTFKSLVAVERISAAFSDHVIAANHIWEDRLHQRSVKPSKLTTILNFPDTQLFRQRGRSRNDDKFIMLYPGTLSYHQGLDIAIRAFFLIKDEVRNAEFHIYGGGDQQGALKLLVADLGLQDRVFLKGAMSTEEITSVIENADLGIVPKRKSGFGNEAFSTKILEFMCMGVPVIVPDTTIDKYYFNESVVKFFKGDDERSLADAILHLSSDSGLRKQLVRNANEFVKKYTWDANQKAYLDVVDTLLESKTGGNGE